jgi:hypothetical protein
MSLAKAYLKVICNTCLLRGLRLPLFDGDKELNIYRRWMAHGLADSESCKSITNSSRPIENRSTSQETPKRTQQTKQTTMAPKTAYITGGASGIGLAVAQALNQRGMRIVVADINISAAQEAVRKLEEASASSEQHHLAVEVDVSSWESQVAAFETAIEAVKRLDVVIVNAGVGEKAFVPNERADKGFVKPNLNILEIDLNGFLYTSALAIQQMRRQEPGEDGLRGRSELELETNRMACS